MQFPPHFVVQLLY